MVEQLWAPWRSSYISRDDPQRGGDNADDATTHCALCTEQRRDDDDPDSLVVARSSSCVVVCNLYPYNNGHLMVVPRRHVGEFTELTADESRDAQQLLESAVTALRTALSAQGFNIGLNLGDVGGAGIPGHLHWHLVPRWAGDSNFMPIIAETKVMNQHLQVTRRRIIDAWTGHGTPVELSEGAEDGV